MRASKETRILELWDEFSKNQDITIPKYAKKYRLTILEALQKYLQYEYSLDALEDDPTIVREFMEWRDNPTINTLKQLVETLKKETVRSIILKEDYNE